MENDKFGIEKAKGDVKRGIKRGFLYFIPFGYLLFSHKIEATAPKQNFLPNKGDLIRFGIAILFFIIIGIIIYLKS
jgi:hypothetical protein